MSPGPIEVRAVTKRYAGRDVLREVTLDVRRGEVLGLVGPNGGGKSTLLLLMAGLVRPDAGDVLIQGQPAHRAALVAAGTVGLITATPGLYPLLSGWENLEFFGALYGLSGPATRARVTPLADRLGITALLDQPVSAGSSGMQQKISALRALLMDPAVLLLDEPTANLDPLSAAALFGVARATADAGRSVVWVTHDLFAAEQICDRVAFIDHRVAHVHTFEGDRRVPPDSPLLRAWRERIGAAP